MKEGKLKEEGVQKLPGEGRAGPFQASEQAFEVGGPRSAASQQLACGGARGAALNLALGAAAAQQQAHPSSSWRAPA